MFVINETVDEGLIPFDNNFVGFKKDLTINKDFLSYGYTYNNNLIGFNHNSNFNSQFHLRNSSLLNIPRSKAPLLPEVATTARHLLSVTASRQNSLRSSLFGEDRLASLGSTNSQLTHSEFLGRPGSNAVGYN